MRGSLLALVLLLHLLGPLAAQSGEIPPGIPQLSAHPELAQPLFLEGVSAARQDFVTMGAQLPLGLLVTRGFEPSPDWVAAVLSQLEAGQAAAYAELVRETGFLVWTLRGAAGFELGLLIEEGGLVGAVEITLKKERGSSIFRYNGAGQGQFMELLRQDAEGRPLQLERRATDGSVSSRQHWVWQDGLLLAEYLSQGQSTSVHRYNAAQRLEQSEQRLNGQPVWRDEYSYVADRLEHKTRIIFSAGVETSVERTQFDSQGRQVLVQSFADGILRALRRFEYAGAGEDLQSETIETYSPQGALLSASQTRYEYREGELISQTVLRDGVITGITEYGPEQTRRERIFLRSEEVLRVYYRGSVRVRQEELRGGRVVSERQF